ncbi:MAG TPA: hypothetical protein VIE65_23550 [Methylobacter sp.]
MTSYIHALMQNSGDVYSGIADPIDDEMLSGGKDTVCRREFRMAVPNLGVVLDRQQGFVEDGAVGVGLRLAPSFKRILQDVGEILFRLRREDYRHIRE